MPVSGDILVYKSFEFEDGTKKDKLFVVMNSPTISHPCLVLKTTSRSERYLGASQGCNFKKKVFYIPTTWQSCFRLDTYIQLPQIFEFTAQELISAGIQDKITAFNTSLSNKCYTQLSNCLKKFRDDISDVHWKILFGK